MKKHKKIFYTFAIILVLCISIVGYGVYWCFYDIQRIIGQEKIKEISSENHKFTVTAFLNNGGATTDYAILCSVKNNDTQKEKNIYWNYPCSDAEIVWIDNDTVQINGIELEVFKDIYDYRHE